MRRFLVLYGVFLFFEQVNDTVGALSLGYYHDPDTVVLVVFGTGSNACYLERTDAIIKSQGLLTTSRSMVLKINSWSILRNKLSYFRSQNVKDLFIHSVSGSQYGVGKFFVLTPAKDFI